MMVVPLSGALVRRPWCGLLLAATLALPTAGLAGDPPASLGLTSASPAPSAPRGAGPLAAPDGDPSRALPGARAERPIGGSGQALKGFGISPVGFPTDYSRILEFLEELGRIPSGALLYATEWRDDVFGGSDAGQIPSDIHGYHDASTRYGFEIVSEFRWHTDRRAFLAVPGNDTNEWTNQEAIALFERMLVDYVTRYRPPVLILGNENDFYYRFYPADYPNWIAAYERLYHAVKAASPDTLVGPGLLYEQIAGTADRFLLGRSFWEALDMHDPSTIDILGLTFFPFLAHRTPEDIPDDYLAPLLERIGDTPIAILETGWPAERHDRWLLSFFFNPYETSESAQVRFIARLDTLLAGFDVRVLNWLWLNRPTELRRLIPDEVIFRPVTLKDVDGNPRRAYDPWLRYQPPAP